MSDLFNEESINAIFLGGGVKGLKGLSDIDRESFSTNIALIPNVIVCLDGFEIDYYKKQIDLLNSKRSKPAIINDRLSAMPILIAKILE